MKSIKSYVADIRAPSDYFTGSEAGFFFCLVGNNSMCSELKWASIVPAGGRKKGGNEDGVVWFHLLAGASILCSSSYSSRLSESERLSGTRHPSDKLSLRLKGEKRKALLSAADWDPRLPSHMWDVRLCMHVCLVRSQEPSWYTTTSSSLVSQVFPRLAFLLWELSKQNHNQCSFGLCVVCIRVIMF